MPTRPRPARPRAQPRRRLDAEAAREGILDAAQKHLVLAGPSGIRLQEVAADAGVSHPTVLHHFGSREALLKAVIARSLQEIHRDLVRAIEASDGDVTKLAAMLDGVFHALTAGGHARVMIWLALEGHRIDAAQVHLRDVVDVTHALRTAKHCARAEASSGPGHRRDGARSAPGSGTARDPIETKGARSAPSSPTLGARPLPSREDTAHIVVLAALALTGLSVMGPTLLDNVGLPHDEAAGARFRTWLAHLLSAHLDSSD